MFEKSKFKYHKEHLCPSCEQGKSKRASHPPKAVPNSRQRCHMDLCGPMRIASINGKRYILVIVDDYSRYTWVHFLRSKDEAPAVIITFLKRITVLLQSPVIIIRTDNGTEFKNQVLKVYFDSVSISHQTSSVRTPQQNGVVERQNQTWDKLSLESYKEKCEKLEKENEKYIIDTLSDQLAKEEHFVKVKQTKISELDECLRKKNSKNEHLKPKVVDCTMCQNLQEQVEELKSVIESFNLSIEELYKVRALAEATLRERDEKISVLQKKLRLLEEQSKVFHEVQSECDSEIFHDIKDNSEKDLILSLQTQLQETAELVVRFANEKYFVLKENESLKDDIKSLQTEINVLKSEESELLEKIDQMKSQVSKLSEKLQISNQEMKQQIILFEEDKRMFLAKNEFLEKLSSSVQKEYNDLMASNDVLRQMKCFDAEKKVFENENSKLEKVLEQQVKDFDEINTELSKRTDKFETYFANLEKENALLKSQLASQNYTSLQKENNDLRTSYNVLKEEYEISCVKLEKENNDLKIHYKRLFDSIKQKNVAS
nr:ribonuclease H-like domain-containing protein [Tanacetum cinerariifolium]